MFANEFYALATVIRLNRCDPHQLEAVRAGQLARCRQWVDLMWIGHCTPPGGSATGLDQCKISCALAHGYHEIHQSVCNAQFNSATAPAFVHYCLNRLAQHTAACEHTALARPIVSAYIGAMLWRVRSSRGRPKNAPAAFIPPCRPTVAKQPPRGEGWAHELKHDGYRLQIHVRDGRVKLYTMNAADWTKRYPRIVEYAARIKGSAIIDAEVVCLDADGIAQFDALHSRVMDHAVVACAFDLLMVDDDDLRRLPLVQR